MLALKLLLFSCATGVLASLFPLLPALAWTSAPLPLSRHLVITLAGTSRSFQALLGNLSVGGQAALVPGTLPLAGTLLSLAWKHEIDYPDSLVGRWFTSVERDCSG